MQVYGEAATANSSAASVTYSDGVHPHCCPALRFWLQHWDCRMPKHVGRLLGAAAALAALGAGAGLLHVLLMA